MDNENAGNVYPMVPGHEIVGHVTQVGSGVTMVSVGDRVGVGPQGGACMEDSCKQCARDANNFCPSRVFTYNSKIDIEPGMTYGGYAEAHITHEAFAIPIPDEMDSAVAAPLLCAGITTYAPLVRFGAHLEAGARVGVVGIGGLGHMAVQYAAAMGYAVTAISRTASKEEEARGFGAQDFLLSSDADAMAAAVRTFDFIICTVSAPLDWELYLSLMAPDGVFCMLGLPPKKMEFDARCLIGNRITLCGSLIGSPAEQIDMLKFSAKHNIAPIIEHATMSQCNEGLDRLRSNSVRYRIVMARDDAQ